MKYTDKQSFRFLNEIDWSIELEYSYNTSEVPDVPKRSVDILH